MADESEKGKGNIISLSDFKKQNEASSSADDAVTHSVTLDFTRSSWEYFNRISREAEAAMGVAPSEKDMDPVALLSSGLKLYEKMCEALARGDQLAVLRRKRRWWLWDRIFGREWVVAGTFELAKKEEG